MIERYTRKKMGQIWSQENKLNCMLEVEVAVARVQAKHKLIPPAAARSIAQKSKFKISEINRIEEVTKHDVIAFVQNVASYVGEHGRFVHYGLTSSDVLDTALALQLREGAQELFVAMDSLDEVLVRLAKKHVRTLCAGRTHGMHAEVTSFGVKLAGFLAELRRQRRRLENSAAGSAYGKLGGAVGNYTNLHPKIEVEVMKSLKLQVETVATQVIPRDRHAQLMTDLALYGGFIERLSVELRHLQRTEVSEVIEGFTPGQKGSSAMPHKKNPISAENLTGTARLLRAYAVAAMENMALWHERDISHSSVERVIFPDAFILADYATARLTDLLKKLHVDTARMRKNMDLSHGMLMSSQLLLLLVQKGLAREEAYKIVQEISHGLKPNENMEKAFLKHGQVKALVKVQEVKKLFSGQDMFQRFELIVQRAIKDKGL